MNENEEKNTNIDNKQTNKNSVILIFSIISAMVFFSIMGAVVYFKPTMFHYKKTNSKPNIKKIEKDPKVVLSDYKMEGNSLEDFDLSFLKIENKEKNEVYSPLSIKYALSMLSSGSDGNSKSQIDTVIGNYRNKKYTNDSHMSFANAMFIKNSYKDNIRDTYIKDLSTNYNAEVILDDFSNANTMNKWVSDRTFNLVNNLFDNNTVKEEKFILTNALAIDMNWNNLIQAASTSSGIPSMHYNVNYIHEEYSDSVPFIIGNDFKGIKFNKQENIKAVEVGASINRYDIVKELGEEEIRKTVSEEYKKWLDGYDGKNDSNAERDINKYLDKYIEELKSNYNKVAMSTDFMFYTDDEVKVFAKDLKEYNGLKLQYVGIMPKKESLKNYIASVDKNKIQNYLGGLKDIRLDNFMDGVITKVHGDIPLFNFEYELDLKEDLKKLKITDIFDTDKANLSNMLVNYDKVYIDSAKHKANIEFSNEGIRAGAATEMGGVGAAAGGFQYDFEVPVEEIDISFNKPYMFIIRDTSSGEVWFTGMVYEPMLK